MSTADDALKEWAHRRHMHTNVPRPVEAAFMAGYRRALEDAADRLAEAFSGLDYTENAQEAASEGEWSWFKWLAVTTLDPERADPSAKNGTPDPLGCVTCGLPLVEHQQEQRHDGMWILCPDRVEEQRQAVVELSCRCGFGGNPNMFNHAVDCPIARDRAAGVGTKDGADDE